MQYTAYNISTHYPSLHFLSIPLIPGEFSPGASPAWSVAGGAGISVGSSSGAAPLGTACTTRPSVVAPMEVKVSCRSRRRRIDVPHNEINTTWDSAKIHWCPPIWAVCCPNRSRPLPLALRGARTMPPTSETIFYRGHRHKPQTQVVLHHLICLHHLTHRRWGFTGQHVQGTTATIAWWNLLTNKLFSKQCGYIWSIFLKPFQCLPNRCPSCLRGQGNPGRYHMLKANVLVPSAPSATTCTCTVFLGISSPLRWQKGCINMSVHC